MPSSDDMKKQLAQKSWMDNIKDAFKPVDAVADENIAKAHENGPTQYDEDMKLSNGERMKKLQKGFLGQ